MGLTGKRAIHSRIPFECEEALHPLLDQHVVHLVPSERSSPVAKAFHRVITYVVRFRESRENRERTRRCDSERNPPEATVLGDKDRKAGE